VRGNPNVHPHLNPPPSKGEEIRLIIFMVCECPPGITYELVNGKSEINLLK
jgi:hypothetical protein